MGAISRRSFVSAAVSGAGALGVGALAGLAGAGALGALPGLARPASAAEPPEGADPVELDATVAVGGASFRCPTWWPVSADAPDDDSVRLDVVDREGGTACGRVTFTVGSPVEGARNTMIPDVIFDGFARSESMATSNCLSAVWGLERLDQEGDAVPMARALCARNWVGDERPSGAADFEFGYLYMALAPDWTLVYAEALADLPSFETLSPQFDAVWDSAAWPAPIAMEDIETASAEFAARALRRGIARNKVRPFYNRHWEVVDISCPGGGWNSSGALMPDHTRYIFSTPEGIETIEYDLVLTDVYYGPVEPPLRIWCMKRTDSEGTDYIRTTVEVEGYGVVDIAHYDSLDYYGWYIADSGTPVIMQGIPLGNEVIWEVFDHWDGTPWRAYFGG